MLGRRVDPGRDRIELDGVALPVLPGLVHYVLNKPVGVVTTADDPHGRPTVVSPRPRRARASSRWAASTPTARDSSS